MKRKLIERLESRLDREEVESARRDPHARRRPRPCGITVHPGHGCPRACSYCYIPEMGFKFERARPYRLSGEGMVLALLYNRGFEPGREGTFIAVGSVTDPFLPELVDKTLEYLKAFSRWLGNPTQFSTKSVIDGEVAESLAGLELPLNGLVTILTPDGEKASRLEPRAPTPEERLETIAELSRAGLTVDLFFRPILPGIVDLEEAEELFRLARDAGARGVVVGGLRVNEGILNRLKRSGFDVSEIVNRVDRSIPKGRKQVHVRTGDIKERLLEVAQEVGLIPFGAACCACASAARVPCPNRCWEGPFCTQCGNPACPV
ncbi:radical SAM protein [Methanopyrus sp.]